MAGLQVDDRIVCTLGATLADGSWLWRIDARRLTRGFSVLIWDADSAWRWRLAKTAEPYSWRRFAAILCEWRSLASRVEDRVDFSLIPRRSNVTVLGESGLAAAILRLCFSDGENPVARWLLAQPDESIATMGAALRIPLSDTQMEALEQIVVGIEELGLPSDLPALCSHYAIDNAGTELNTLRECVEKDMAKLLAVRERRVAKFRAQIDALTRDIDDRPARVAGMGLPSRRQRLTDYLKDFVARNDTLPTGVHTLSSSDVVNFDELRRKHGL
jgi:hypothetical protein